MVALGASPAGSNVISFASLTKDCERWEVCRKFLSVLSLVLDLACIR